MTESLQQLINHKLSGLTGSQTKAFLIIWSMTHADNKKSRKITNDAFIFYGGKSLANKPAVVNATNALHDMGLIYKTLDNTDSLNFYSINDKF